MVSGAVKQRPRRVGGVDRTEVVGDLDECPTGFIEVVSGDPVAEGFGPVGDGWQAGGENGELGTGGLEDAVDPADGCICAPAFEAGDR